MIRVIKGDPAISSRIVRTVNSSLFGFRQPISSIDAAVPILGANLVRTLVLSFTLASDPGPASGSRRPYQRLWRTCVTQAVAAEALATELPGIDHSVWFLGGILQDVGRLALLAAVPETYGKIVHDAGDALALLALEHEAFGFTHVDVSVQLCQRWRLDNYLIDAIAKHHGLVLPWNQSPSQSPQTLPLLPNALRCATLITDYVEQLRAGRPTVRTLLEQTVADAFPGPALQVGELLRDVDLRVGEVAAMFAVDLGDYLSIDQILEQAKSTLAAIALQSQLAVHEAQRGFEEVRQELQNLGLK
jgi:HD-like signal output (HDOD) protein